jgi:hypothetical protein
MVMRVLLGIVAGVGGFILSALAELTLRGLESAAIVLPTGVVVSLLPGWSAWVAGVVLLVLAVLGVVVLRRVDRVTWAVAAAVLLVLLVTGSVLAAGWEFDPQRRPAPAPALWLITGASSALAWVLAGLTAGLALRRTSPSSSVE